MKPKLLAVTAALVLLLAAFPCMAGCSNADKPGEVASADAAEKADGATFELLDNERQANGCFIRVYRDKLTNVIWVEDIFQGSYKGGASFSPRINADGTPMTYEQYKEALGKL